MIKTNAKPTHRVDAGSTIIRLEAQRDGIEDYYTSSADAISVAGSELDSTSSSSQPSANAEPLFLIVNNSRNIEPSAFKSVSVNDGYPADPNNLVVEGAKISPGLQFKLQQSGLGQPSRRYRLVPLG